MIPNYDSNMAWPPESWRGVYARYSLHDAWYSGDPNRLAEVYGAIGSVPNLTDFFSSFGTDNGHFWARDLSARRRTTLHVPLAGDLASTSAALLFSESPKVKIPEAFEENAPAEATAAQLRLDELLTEGGARGKFSEAAEIAAALGGVFLKVNWDQSLSPMPILNIAQPDQALPEFSHGILRAVTFWKVLEDDGYTTWRLLERHEPGWIYNAVYKGTPDTIGSKELLADRPETAGTMEAISVNPSGGLACVYVPNARPNRYFRNDAYGKDLGQSDYSGAETLMESLDETYSSLLRDIRLGVGRIIVPRDFFGLDSDGNLRFDVDREAYVGLDMMQQPGKGPKDSITLSQFAIRTQEHIDTATDLVKQILRAGGYSPQTFGFDINGTAESGTALTIRERKSFITAARKAEYWRPAIERILYVMQVVDREKLGGKTTPMPVAVEMQDSVRSDIDQVATSIELLSRAGAASKEVLVRMQHPDWTREQVDAEVKLILDEQGMGVPDPIQIGQA